MKKENLLKVFFFHCILAMIICPFTVKADTINLGTPNYYAFSGHNVELSIGGITTIGDYYFSGSFSSGASASTYLTTFIFHYDNLNLCVDKICTIKGTFVTEKTQYQALRGAMVHFTSSNGVTTQCSISAFRNDDNNVDFVCSGINASNGGDFVIDHLMFLADPPNRVGLYKKVDITCETSNNEIIGSIGTATNEIMNNIGNSKNEINANIEGVKENQQQTNEKLDGINDSLKDDSIDSEGASSFFDSFSDTDHGGLSGVITAPLRFVNKITATCEPINFKMWNKDISLPCGDTLFWGKSEVKPLRDVWNILFGGGFLYMLMLKLYRTVQNLKNPDDDRIEMMDL